MVKEKIIKAKDKADMMVIMAMNSGAGVETLKLMRAVRAAACCVMTALMTTMAFSPAFATNGQTQGQNAIKGVLRIIYLFTMALGIMFVTVGFVRLVIAHSQEDSPGQQRASMFIATGIALLAVRPVLGAIGVEKWFVISPSTTGDFSK